jgi:hypothetical protein
MQRTQIKPNCPSLVNPHRKFDSSSSSFSNSLGFEDDDENEDDYDSGFNMGFNHCCKCPLLFLG